MGEMSPCDERKLAHGGVEKADDAGNVSDGAAFIFSAVNVKFPAMFCSSHPYR